MPENWGPHGSIDIHLQDERLVRARSKREGGKYNFEKTSLCQRWLTLRRKIRALAESQHLMIDPGRLKRVPGYPRMNGGFSTVRVAKLDDSLLVAVKEIRISCTDDDQARFAIVSCFFDRLQVRPYWTAGRDSLESSRSGLNSITLTSSSYLGATWIQK